jgi:hypothetical protein
MSLALPQTSSRSTGRLFARLADECLWTRWNFAGSDGDCHEEVTFAKTGLVLEAGRVPPGDGIESGEDRGLSTA